MGPYELNITRGLIAGLLAGTLAFAVPWLLLCLLLFTQWLGNDIYISLDGAWLGSYFLASIVGTAAFVSFGTRPRTAARNATGFVVLGAIVIVLALASFRIVSEQYYVAQLRSLGAEVSYGPKGGYFVTGSAGSDASRLLKRGTPAINYLSRRYLTTLRLDEAQLVDSDLQHLEHVQGSIFVSLKNTGITDAAIECLKRVPNLSGVDVSGSHVSDEAIAALWKAKHWPKAEQSHAPHPAAGPGSSGASSPPAR